MSQIFLYLLCIHRDHEVSHQVTVVRLSPIGPSTGDNMPDVKGGSVFINNISNLFRPSSKI
jgi:hypothetical protein